MRNALLIFTLMFGCLSGCSFQSASHVSDNHFAGQLLQEYTGDLTVQQQAERDKLLTKHKPLCYKVVTVSYEAVQGSKSANFCLPTPDSSFCFVIHKFSTGKENDHFFFVGGYENDNIGIMVGGTDNESKGIILYNNKTYALEPICDGLHLLSEFPDPLKAQLR